jgi:hypothetical protein
MAEHAGFAVAVTIREGLINNSLLTSYAKNTFPRTLSHDLPGTTPPSAINMFLAPPVINCLRNKMTIAVEMWGTVNRLANLTPYRRPILTPLSGAVWR